MQVSTGALSALLLVAAARHADGFTAPATFAPRLTTSALRMAAGGGEFDHILGDGWEQSAQTSAPQQQSRKAILRVPDGSPAVTHTSSITAPRTSGDDVFTEEEDFDVEGSGAAEGSERGEGYDSFQSSVAGDTVSDDPYIQEMMRKQQVKEVRTSMFNPKTFLEGKDFTDIFFTVLLPVGGLAYGATWLYGRGNEKMGDNADDGLEDYAREMCYQDGDFDAMKATHKSWGAKLAWLGPGKKDRMLREYLETFAKKVTVSPQSISSLSYAFSLFKLSEDKAATALSDLCLSIPDKTASVGKLLFFGSHILKSDEAKAKLSPISDMLANSYREDAGLPGDEIVQASQNAMGEAAYREAITKAGKNQGDKLTVGWEVLGLSQFKAQKIFDEEAETGFVSSKEAKYSRAKLKYNDKGQRVDADGNRAFEDGQGPKPGEEEDDAAADEEEGEVSNVYECGSCGYTLFVAEGRNAKFFGTGFVCPECGAEKDQFVGRTMGEE